MGRRDYPLQCPFGVLGGGPVAGVRSIFTKAERDSASCSDVPALVVGLSDPIFNQYSAVGGRMQHENFSLGTPHAQANMPNASGAPPGKKQEIARLYAVALNAAPPIGIARAAGRHGIAIGFKKVLLKSGAVESPRIYSSGAVGLAQNRAVSLLQRIPGDGVLRSYRSLRLEQACYQEQSGEVEDFFHGGLQFRAKSPKGQSLCRKFGSL